MNHDDGTYEPPAIERREAVTEPLIGYPSPVWQRPDEADDGTR